MLRNSSLSLRIKHKGVYGNDNSLFSTRLNFLPESVRLRRTQKGVNYIEKNVAVDETALAELEKLGVMSTPVTVINGEVIIGFDQNKLELALNKISS